MRKSRKFFFDAPWYVMDCETSSFKFLKFVTVQFEFLFCLFCLLIVIK